VKNRQQNMWCGHVGHSSHSSGTVAIHKQHRQVMTVHRMLLQGVYVSTVRLLAVCHCLLLLLIRCFTARNKSTSFCRQWCKEHVEQAAACGCSCLP
jgi:hypothetical protein